MPGKALRNVRGILLKKEKKPSAWWTLIINMCQLTLAVSMLPSLLESSHHVVFRLPKQRPSIEGSDPRVGFKALVCHLLAE